MAAILTQGKQSYLDNAGNFLVGGKLYTYDAGTNTPRPTYSDAAGLVPNTNPIILDARGEATIFWNGVYKLVLKDSADNTIWTVDFVSDPATASGLATILARLADFSTAANGAGMAGFSWSVPYPANTIAAALQGSMNIRQFGNFVGDGVTDDSAVWIAAAASGARIIDARGVNSKILAQVDIRSNQTWLLSGSQINTAGTALTVFSAVQKTNWHLMGPFRITGDLVTNPGTGVSSKGVYIEDCSNWSILEGQFFNIKGYGIDMAPGASSRSRGDGGVVISPRFKDCVWGWRDTAGTGSEYCTVINAHATGCAQAGITTAAGNIVWLGGHSLDNILDGMRVTAGANHAHGMVIGMNLNHNPQYNLVCTQVVNGQDFIGCHFYGNAANSAQAAIFLDRSKGIHISDGHWDCAVYNYKDGSSGQNIIEGMYCPGGYGINRLAGGNDGHDQLVIRRLFGPGQYAAAIAGGIEATGASLNQLSTSFASASRDATVTVNLTSGVATTLVWPNVAISGAGRGNPFGILNVGTGEFTFTEPGWYTFEGNQIFAATTINQAASFLDLQIDSGGGFQSYELYIPAPAFGGGGSMTCLHRSRFYISAAGYKLRLQATITGTGTITHGRTTWRSWAELRRDA